MDLVDKRINWTWEKNISKVYYRNIQIDHSKFFEFSSNPGLFEDDKTLNKSFERFENDKIFIDEMNWGKILLVKVK